MTTSRARYFESFVGLRYIWSRSGNRFISFISTISILGIAVGVAVLVVVLSVVNGFETELRLRILSMTAHATISGYGDDISDWRTASQLAASNPHVTRTAPFISGDGMLVRGDNVSGVAIRGIFPSEELLVSGIGEKMKSGALDDLQAGQFGIVLGAALAEVLEVDLGDKLILAVNQGTVTAAGIMPRVRRFTVVGVFEAGMFEYDRGLAFIHLEDGARLYRMGETVSGLRLKLDDMFLAPEVVRDVAIAMGGLKIIEGA